MLKNISKFETGIQVSVLYVHTSVLKCELNHKAIHTAAHKHTTLITKCSIPMIQNKLFLYEYNLNGL